MITLLSPTKTQSIPSHKKTLLKTKPIEIQKANFLMSLLKKFSVDELSILLKISQSIALKAKEAIGSWQTDCTHAICLFQGDAFQKLDVQSLTEDDVLFAQDHLIIFSALYGYLRPLDAVSPYRLDLKDRLKIPGFQNLYDYWRDAVTLGLNNIVLKSKNNWVLNLASGEYSDVIDQKKFIGKMVNVEFKVRKDNDYKTVGIYAKRGRGLLARYMIKHRIDVPEKIIDFNDEGFVFSESLSTDNNYVFIL